MMNEEDKGLSLTKEQMEIRKMEAEIVKLLDSTQ